MLSEKKTRFKGDDGFTTEKVKAEHVVPEKYNSLYEYISASF